MNKYKLYFFKDNSTFYAEEDILGNNILSVKELLIKNELRYKNMHIVIFPYETNTNVEFPALILRRDRKYGM